MSQVLNTRAVAERLGMSERYVRDLAASGKIPAHRMPASRGKYGYSLRFDSDEIEAWWKSTRIGATA